MPPPVVYSESIFADYLTSVLGSFADVLSWTTGSPAVQEAISDALLDYGDTTIANISGTTNMRRIRALGRRAIWRAVVQATAADYTVTDNSQTLEREQLQKQSLKALELAEAECREWDPSYSVSVVSVKRPHDPYVVILDSERVS